MIYKVTKYTNGKPYIKTTAEAENHEELAKKFKGQVLVEGKTIKRFRGGKEQTGTPRVFKYGEKGDAGILLMVGSFVEKFTFNYVSTRNEVFKKCTGLMSANSANPKKQLTTITVYLRGMSDSNDSSMSPKTSKDSVVTVIKPDKYHPLLTGEIFGSEDAKNMEKFTWKAGYEASPSKPNQTFWAKVKDLSKFDVSDYPGINRKMLFLSGKVIEVTEKSDLWKGLGWYWKEEWLEFKVVGKVNCKDGQKGTLDGKTDSVVGEMESLNGKVLEFTYNSLGWLKTANPHEFSWHPDWIIPSKMCKIKPQSKNGMTYTKEMQKMVGKTFPFDKQKHVFYVNGFFFKECDVEIL